MKHLLAVIVIAGIIAGLSSPAIAHSVHYHVENRGISTRIFYAEDDPASYTSYEIFGPGDKIPHQKGSIVVAFLLAIEIHGGFVDCAVRINSWR